MKKERIILVCPDPAALEIRLTLHEAEQVVRDARGLWVEMPDPWGIYIEGELNERHT